ISSGWTRSDPCPKCGLGKLELRVDRSPSPDGIKMTREYDRGKGVAEGAPGADTEALRGDC
ncbi:MAG: hypothetical protein V3U04_07925, partial [Candidatus Aerophobetes bacterium]